MPVVIGVVGLNQVGPNVVAPLCHALTGYNLSVMVAQSLDVPVDGIDVIITDVELCAQSDQVALRLSMAEAQQPPIGRIEQALRIET